MAWCERHGLALNHVRPADVGDYIKMLAKPNGEPASKPTRKLHLAGLRHFFDKLVVRHAVILNPAASVRGPRHGVAEEVPAELLSPRGDAVDLYALTTSLAAAVQSLKSQVDEQAKMIETLRAQLADRQ